MSIDFLTFLSQYGPTILVVVGVLYLLIDLERNRRERREDRRKQEKSEQSKENLATERRRLAEVNIRVDHKLVLTLPSDEASKEKPFTIFSMPLKNIGDGPVDILASLTASRIMSSKYKVGMGLRNRDVEWEDHEPHFWNGDPAGLFTGTSTTRTMVSSGDEFLRLAAKEYGTLRRIDAVNNKPLLIKRQPIYMLYRVFLVARGYPLGEILRQLGGGPPDPLQNVDKLQLEFRTLAQPNYGRWQAVQQALLNLSRLAFKVGSDEEDALGLLATPDGWRFFLLHHQDFIGPINLAGGKTTTMNAVAQGLWENFYPKKVLPDDFGSDPAYRQAKQYCQEQLAPMLARWRTLKQTIQECHEFDPVKGYPPSAFAAEPAVKAHPPEGYPVRIHTDPFYRERWLKLVREGYLMSRPFAHEPHGRVFGREQGTDSVIFDVHDIPADPRVLEPFVMRTHYFLETLSLEVSNPQTYL